MPIVPLAAGGVGWEPGGSAGAGTAGVVAGAVVPPLAAGAGAIGIGLSGNDGLAGDGAGLCVVVGSSTAGPAGWE
jgi:hypothetical protein